MKVQKKGQKNKGFTLIELVVVVAIIGVLAAIVTPRIRTALMKAKDAKAVATLDALRTATNVYYAEKGKAPYFAATGDDGAAVPAADTPLTEGHLALLVKSGYLDIQSAQRLDPDVDQALVDGYATIDAIAIGETIPNMAVGVVQARATECTADANGIYQPNSDAANTPGEVQFLWAKDGVGLYVLPTAVGGGAAPADPVNTSCELWDSK